MSLDINRFHGVFFEEAAEHLADFERLLLGLSNASPSGDDLNAIFRCAHSIKGGAATFGFDALAKLTHALETVLDQVRKATLPISRSLVDILLHANDVLKAHIAAIRGNGTPDAATEHTLLEHLEAIATGRAALSLDTTQINLDGLAPAPVAAANEQHGASYSLAFDLTPPEARDLALQADLVQRLGAIGTVSAHRIQEQGEAKRLLIELATALPRQDLLESLVFLWPAQRLHLEAMPRPAPAPSGSDTDFGFFAENLPAALERKAATQAEEPKSVERPAVDPLAVTSFGRRAYDLGSGEAPFGRRASDRAVAPVADANSIRVGVEKIDRLVNLVGELVTAQAMLTQNAARLSTQAHEQLSASLAQMERNTRDLHEAVMSVRMLPLDYVFNRFPRVVRDLAQKLGKKARIEIEGADTEIDKGLIEKLADPLTHLVRNAIDHGIEAPEERGARGKDRIGTVSVAAAHHGGDVVIEVRDDGAGLDRDRILAKARERGMAIAENAPDAALWQLIFAPGFSTAREVTDVSGRGVGMDIVRRNIEALNGRIELSSQAGHGTKITIRLPLTLAIIDGMLVGVGNHSYVIPLNFIIENLQPGANDVKTIAGRGRVVHIRGSYIPLVALSEILNIDARATDPAQGILVVCELDDRRAALLVDDLLGQGQFVIKSLESNFRRVDTIAGATILGDGRVALILDVSALLQNSRAAA